jgi:hypothetical protein
MDRETSVDILALDDIEEAKGKAGQVSIAIRDGEGEGGWLIGNDEIGRMPAKLQSPKTVLREQSGYHDQAEHHREE